MMTLQEIRQMNPAGAKTGIVTKAQLISVEETGKTTTGKVKQKIIVEDSGGQHKITLYPGNNPPLTVADDGLYFDFKVWCNEFKGKIYFQAFLDSPEPVAAPANAKQITKTVNNQNDEARRGYALRYAVDLCIGGAFAIDEIYGFADRFVNYMQTGSATGQQTRSEVPPPVTGLDDEPIPF